MFINGVIALFAEMLADHASNQGEMEEVNGFPILGMLFQKIAKFMDTQTVTIIDKLIRSISLSESLLKDAYSSLFMNFDIWILTAFPIQRQLSSILVKRVESNSQVQYSIFEKLLTFFQVL